MTGFVKLKGYAVNEILTSLFIFPFMLIDSVRGFIIGNYQLSPAKKDTFYRFINNENLNWRSLLYSAAKKFRALTLSLESKPGITCAILDDSLLKKRGVKIEGIGNVFDHVSRKSVLGFKCLLLCFWDGKSVFPLDFSLHAEKGKNKKRPYGMSKKKLKERFSKERADSSPGKKRINELKQDKISVGLELIKRAAKHGFIPQYLLCDSWFSSEKFIAGIRKVKKGAIHFLGMVRQDKRCYSFDNQKLNAADIKKRFKGSAKRCRKLNSRYFELVVEYKGIKLKLFFTRFSNQNKWQLIAVTDLRLSYINAMEIYSLRWGIEVLFKECKQHLNLGKCQSNDFDAQIAETTISFMLYTMLAFYKRVHAYETMGSLFAHLKDQLIEATIAERLWLIFLELQKLMAEIFEIDVIEYFHKLINSEKGEALLRALIGVLPSQHVNNAA